ncbi:MAG TPA: glycosyltransferase family 4 protein [Hyphomicrobiales bacterium]|nr:glycosyltransferase family 4 protein [Hyphomicrobiales bacterium]
MKIAQIAPLAESCPPRLYGGTERVVTYLTDELARQGHEVTLFASGDSVTRGELVPCSEMALRLNPAVKDPIPHHLIMLDKVRRRAHEFDILHFHVDLLHFPLIQDFVDKTLTTIHLRLDEPELVPFYTHFQPAPLASVSLAQRRHMPSTLNWAGNVYHGLPPNLLTLNAKAKGEYLAFLGRISPEKRPDRAIEIAKRAGLPLKIAAKVDKKDEPYWETIKPMIAANPNVEFVGEINEYQKAKFLGEALAVLFPIDWPEPFGMVMIEAMACGTPVIAFACGSVQEVIDDGVTGYVVKTVEEAVGAVERVALLDRTEVRAVFERRFAAERMANDYLAIYRRIASAYRETARAKLVNGYRVGAQMITAARAY